MIFASTSCNSVKSRHSQSMSCCLICSRTQSEKQSGFCSKIVKRSNKRPAYCLFAGSRASKAESEHSQMSLYGIREVRTKCNLPLPDAPYRYNIVCGGRVYLDVCAQASGCILHRYGGDTKAVSSKKYTSSGGKIK